MKLKPQRRTELQRLRHKLLQESAPSLQEKHAPKEHGEDSLDDQVDRFLVDYETEAKMSKSEGLDFRSMTRRFLQEADDEDKDEDKTDEKGDDEKSEPLARKSDLDEIDMGSFVRDVMRLVENVDSLLEVRNTVLRRAANFIANKYESDAVDSFKEELLESYGIEIGRSDSEKEDEFQAPKAGASGPAGAGT